MSFDSGKPIDGDPLQLDGERKVFFRRTRRTATLLYVCLSTGAVVTGVLALSQDIAEALIGFAFGVVVMLGLFAIGLVRPGTPKGLRAIIFVLIPLSVIGVTLLPETDVLESALGFGAYAGGMAGAVLGIAYIRRRLGRDDKLWRRLNPLAWVHGT